MPLNVRSIVRPTRESARVRRARASPRDVARAARAFRAIYRPRRVARRARASRASRRAVPRASLAATRKCPPLMFPPVGAPRDSATRMAPTAPRRRRPSARGKKSRALDRRADPLAYYTARVDRWFDRHPIAGAGVTVVTLAAFLYVALRRVARTTGLYRRHIARHAEPLLMKHVVAGVDDVDGARRARDATRRRAREMDARPTTPRART